MKSLYIFAKWGDIFIDLIIYGVIAIIIKYGINFITGNELDNTVYYSSIFTMLLIQEIRRYRAWVRENEESYIESSDEVEQNSQRFL